jgi:hypothetical protein
MDNMVISCDINDGWLRIIWIMTLSFTGVLTIKYLRIQLIINGYWLMTIEEKTVHVGDCQNPLWDCLFFFSPGL